MSVLRAPAKVYCCEAAIRNRANIHIPQPREQLNSQFLRGPIICHKIEGQGYASDIRHFLAHFIFSTALQIVRNEEKKQFTNNAMEDPLLNLRLFSIQIENTGCSCKHPDYPEYDVAKS